MKTITRLIYRQIVLAVAFVSLAFLALFFFFDITDELGHVQSYGKHGYTIWHAFAYVALKIPSRLYDLLPIAVLIGTIYVLVQLAQTSQFTIMRTSGLGPLQALGALLALGLGFVVLTFALGDYVAPAANRIATTVQARFMGDITVGRTGAWLKDLQGEQSYSINVGSMSADGQLKRVRILAFDATAESLQSTLDATTADITPQGWELHDVRQRDFSQAQADPDHAHISTSQHEQLLWKTGISADMIAAALLSPERMRTVELLRYANHLEATGQNAQSYEIEFWRKVFYPLGCLVMMVLALPFAYLHFRSSNISSMVFLGVLIGISFFLLNNVFGFIGNLRHWSPWLAAASPGIVYSILSLAAFTWLVARQ
ncbi:MAG: LPS export ABC transporter permease LptG [Ottowia sp.]|nr:LPS export ABC transporter permease LptG [Ottowia sp.]